MKVAEQGCSMPGAGVRDRNWSGEKQGKVGKEWRASSSLDPPAHSLPMLPLTLKSLRLSKPVLLYSGRRVSRPLGKPGFPRKNCLECSLVSGGEPPARAAPAEC